MIPTVRLYILILTKVTLDLDSSSQECEKAKTSEPIISQGFSIDLDGILCTVDTTRRDDPILTLSRPFDMQGEKDPAYVILLKTFFTLTCIQVSIGRLLLNLV